MIAKIVKKFGRGIVCGILERQVRQLRKRHVFKVVAVVGSIGKTSTKMAIAGCLEQNLRVRYQTGNYNDRVTVPLIFFDQPLPPLWNAFAWIKVFLANRRQIRGSYDFDVVIVELGVDGPGQMRFFKYLHPDISVVTAITPEHMEYFKTLDSVAAEELSVINFSKQTLVNADDTESKYMSDKDVKTYGASGSPTYLATNINDQGLKGSSAILKLQNNIQFSAQTRIIGLPGVKIVLAAAAVAQLIGLTEAQIQKGIENIQPFSGRMRVFKGIKQSTIIDDTYNASPAPVKSALDVLYATDCPQRVAILGNMNELGDYSEEAHREVGEYCRADKLDLVVAIGRDAAAYLAPAAEKNGCKVERFMNPYDAGTMVLERLQQAAVVLAEGSQNGVFAEEAIKPLLLNPEDAANLVRQSPYWMAVKKRQFNR